MQTALTLSMCTSSQAVLQCRSKTVSFALSTTSARKGQIADITILARPGTSVRQAVVRHFYVLLASTAGT